jgi:hypothetical protein
VRKVGCARVAIVEQLVQVDFTVDTVDVRRQQRPRAAAGQVDDRGGGGHGGGDEGGGQRVRELLTVRKVGCARVAIVEQPFQVDFTVDTVDQARVRAAHREGGAVAEQLSTATVNIPGAVAVDNHIKQLLEIVHDAHHVDTAALAYRALAGASTRLARPQSACTAVAFQFPSGILERFHLWESSHSVDGNELRFTHPAEMIRLLLAIEFLCCRRTPLILGNVHPTK